MPIHAGRSDMIPPTNSELKHQQALRASQADPGIVRASGHVPEVRISPISELCMDEDSRCFDLEWYYLQLRTCRMEPAMASPQISPCDALIESIRLPFHEALGMPACLKRGTAIQWRLLMACWNSNAQLCTQVSPVEPAAVDDAGAKAQHNQASTAAVQDASKCVTAAQATHAVPVAASATPRHQHQSGTTPGSGRGACVNGRNATSKPTVTLGRPTMQSAPTHAGVESTQSQLLIALSGTGHAMRKENTEANFFWGECL